MLLFIVILEWRMVAFGARDLVGEMKCRRDFAMWERATNGSSVSLQLVDIPFFFHSDIRLENSHHCGSVQVEARKGYDFARNEMQYFWMRRALDNMAWGGPSCHWTPSASGVRTLASYALCWPDVYVNETDFAVDYITLTISSISATSCVLTAKIWSKSPWTIVEKMVRTVW